MRGAGLSRAADPVERAVYIPGRLQALPGLRDAAESKFATGWVCLDFMVDFLGGCDNLEGPRMASAGCRQNGGLECDIDEHWPNKKAQLQVKTDRVVALEHGSRQAGKMQRDDGPQRKERRQRIDVDFC